MYGDGQPSSTQDSGRTESPVQSAVDDAVVPPQSTSEPPAAPPATSQDDEQTSTAKSEDPAVKNTSSHGTSRTAAALDASATEALSATLTGSAAGTGESTSNGEAPTDSGAEPESTDSSNSESTQNTSTSPAFFQAGAQTHGIPLLSSAGMSQRTINSVLVGSAFLISALWQL